MIIEAIGIFSIAIIAQVLLVLKAADILSNVASTTRDSGLVMSTGRVA